MADVRTKCRQDRRPALDEIDSELKITINLRTQVEETRSGLLSSGGATLVPVMQSADLRDSDDPASIWRLHTAWLRAALLQC